MAEYIIQSDCKFDSNTIMAIGPTHYISDVKPLVITLFTSKNTLDMYKKKYDKCNFKSSVVNPLIKVFFIQL